MVEEYVTPDLLRKAFSYDLFEVARDRVKMPFHLG
jgi:hypothetical protein